MKRATTSLPVPDSPVTSTVVSVFATWVASATPRAMRRTAPTIRRFIRLLTCSTNVRARPSRDLCERAASASEPLARAVHATRQREMTDDAMREREVAAIDGVRLLRPERDAHAPIARLDGDAQQRPIAARLDPLPDVPRADHPEYLFGEVADDEFPSIGVPAGSSATSRRSS